MQFIVIAHDHKDEKALERRLSARNEHLDFAQKMFDEKKWLYATALLSEEGKMNGSVIVCDFPSEDELKKQWLNIESYIINKVWDDITIRKAQVAPHCL